MRVEKLRVHHLLCTKLYVGKGYSEEFVVSMDKVISRLKKAEQIVLTTSTDEICKHCPNKTSNNRCELDEDKVVVKDEFLLQVLKLKLGMKYNKDDLNRYMREKLTKDIFNYSCGSCNWFKLGLCTYEKYRIS